VESSTSLTPPTSHGFLIGEKVYLRPVEKDDLAHIRAWVNNPEVHALIGETRPMSVSGADAFYDELQHDESRIWFIIVEKASHRPIGECGLLRMTPTWRTTDLSIIISERDARGRGYGTEAITLLMDYAFGALNVHRIAIGVVGFNERALRFYEKIGFQREGIQREGYYWNQQYYDFVMMSILEHEFRALHDNSNRQPKGRGAYAPTPPLNAKD
jgi:RimJ/RimL family protein N-acetyltransferase